MPTPTPGSPHPDTAGDVRTHAYRELGNALDRIPFRRAHVWILVLVASGALFDAIEQYNVGLASPLIANQFDLSKASVGLLTTLTFAGMALGSLIAGVTGDKYGRRITYCTTSCSTPSVHSSALSRRTSASFSSPVSSSASDSAASSTPASPSSPS